MRLLFVTNRYPTADTPGDSPCIEQQARSLQARGHTVDVLWIASQKTRLAYLSSAYKLLRDVQLRGQYDLVHSHFGWTNAILGALQQRVPHVITLRGSDVMVPGQLAVTKPLVKRAAGVIVMSAEMQHVLAQPNVEIIPYGIDMAIYRPMPRAEARRQLGLHPDKPLVLFPYDKARRRKRYDLVDAAMQQVNAHVSAEAIAIYKSTPEEVALYMNACDALVLTSNWEGSPSAIREAMACNLPIVTVAVGDAAEHVANLPDSSVVAQDANAIAAGLLPLLMQPRRADSRLAAMATSYDATAARVEAVYARALGRSEQESAVWTTQTGD